jgi:hypothetical protein
LPAALSRGVYLCKLIGGGNRVYGRFVLPR